MSNTDKRLTQEQLSEILDLHGKWLREEAGGVQANMRYANLEGANLEGANLTGANLTNAILTGANMWYAILTGANLTGANLEEANLTGASLTGASLEYAILTGANLEGANMWYANLRDASLEYAILTGANLRDANLEGANLEGANLEGANLAFANLEDANLRDANLRDASLEYAILEGAKLPSPVLGLSNCTVGYKKVWNRDRSEQVVIELRFPEGAKLVSTVAGRKCRASEAVVVRCVSTGHEDETEFLSLYDGSFTYRVGETVEPVGRFDDSVTVECTSGIHFFTTQGEAEDYQF